MIDPIKSEFQAALDLLLEEFTEEQWSMLASALFDGVQGACCDHETARTIAKTKRQTEALQHVAYGALGCNLDVLAATWMIDRCLDKVASWI